MPGAPEPFCIGAYIWPGLAKLMEELGENGQVLGKIIAFPERADNDEPHPDGTLLKERIEFELGDLLAAIEYVVDHNELNRHQIEFQRQLKLARFNDWHDEERVRMRIDG